MNEKQLYLYKIEPRRPEMLTEGMSAEEEAIMGKHFAYLKEQTENGTIFLAGPSFRADGSGFGITIFEAINEAGAEAFMNNDPAVQEGIMNAEWFQFRLSLLGDVDSSLAINDLRNN